jgi:hypothetical protein
MQVVHGKIKWKHANISYGLLKITVLYINKRWSESHAERRQTPHTHIHTYKRIHTHTYAAIRTHTHTHTTQAYKNPHSWVTHSLVHKNPHLKKLSRMLINSHIICSIHTHAHTLLLVIVIKLNTTTMHSGICTNHFPAKTLVNLYIYSSHFMSGAQGSANRSDNLSSAQQKGPPNTHYASWAKQRMN